MNLRRLLVPIDFGPAADHAVELAISLAIRFDGRVELMHAFHLPSTVYMADGPLVAFPLDKLIRDEREALGAALARAKHRYPAVEATWVDGEPRRAILDIAKDHRADVIVMGTHGRRPPARLFFGSVAERLVRTSPVPVLTTAGPPGPVYDGAHGAAFRHILVPTHFGEPAERALDAAIELANRFDSKLTILHAYDRPSMPLREHAEDSIARVERAAERRLEGAVTRALALHAKVESTLVRGDPRERILEIGGGASGVDLVVMGTHQKRGLSRLFLGSVAERVVRASIVPVLTIGANGADSNAG